MGGLIASANRGTLFLDEIGEMPFELQSRLLRILQLLLCRRHEFHPHPPSVIGVTAPRHHARRLQPIEQEGHGARAQLALLGELPCRHGAPAWQLSEATDLIELGREGVWVPDYKAAHTATGTEVFIEVLGFWKRSSLERLMRLLPLHGPPRFVLAISERLKVDEEAIQEFKGPILRFKEIHNASELAGLLESFVSREKPAEPQLF